MRKLLLAALLAAPLLASAAQTNLLTNGSFEDGLNGWTVSGTLLDAPGYPVVSLFYNSATPYPTGAYGEAVNPDNAISPSPDAVGERAAYFVDDFAQPETLSQTIQLVAGTQYEFGFDAYLPQNGVNNAGPAAFSASFDGVTFGDFSVGNGPAQEWVHYSAIGTAVSTGNATFTFSFLTNANPSKDVVIDRVYVMTAVPEPETYALMLAGLAAVGFMSRRRPKA